MQIFERIEGGIPVRLDPTEDLKSGFQRLIVLCLAKPGDYFAYDDQEGRIVAEVWSYQHQDVS